jgi:hypothetical protein
MINRTLFVVFIALTLSDRLLTVSAEEAHDLTLKIPTKGKDAPNQIVEKVKGLKFNRPPIQIEPISNDYKIEELLQNVERFRQLIQQPLDSYILYRRILKEGDVDVAMSRLVALNDPEADAKAVAFFKTPTYLKGLRNIGAGASSVEPVLLIEDRADLVELYVRETGLDNGTEYKICNIVKLKKTNDGWILLPSVISDKDTQGALRMRIMQAIGNGALSIDDASKTPR